MDDLKSQVDKAFEKKGMKRPSGIKSAHSPAQTKPTDRSAVALATDWNKAR